MKKIMLSVIVGLFLMGMSSTARAAILDSVTPFGFPSLISPDYGTEGSLASRTYSFDMDSNAVKPVLGQITQNVYRNDTGMLFTFDIERNSTGWSNGGGTEIGLGTLGADDYSGFMVDANYTNYPDNLGLAPLLAIRTGASDVSFMWAYGFVADTHSSRLLLQTDAPYFTHGKFSLQSGGNTESFNGFGPTATPEPATMVLLGIGLAGMGMLRRKSQAA